MNLSFEFAFEGFRIIRQRPKLILFWGLLSLIGNGAISLLLVGMAGPAFMTIARLNGQTPDPQTTIALSSQIMPAFAAGLPIYILTSAILSAAICRAVAGERDEHFGFMRFGRPELLLIILEIVMLAMRAFIMLGFLLLGEAASQAMPGPVGDACLSLSMLAGVGIVLWLSVRLSLNTAQTFDDRRLSVFSSFALTQDYFWSLFAGYAVAFGLALVVMFLCNQIIAGAQVLVFGAAAVKGGELPDMSSLAAFLTPANIIDLVLSGALLSPLTASILIAAPIAAYRTLRTPRKPLTV